MCTFGRTISVRINCVFTLLHSPRPHKLSHLSSAYVHIQASFIYAVHDVCDICDCGIQPPYTPIELLCIGHSIATLESSITHAVGTMPLRTNTHAHAITAQDRQTSERNSRREPRGRERESGERTHMGESLLVRSAHEGVLHIWHAACHRVPLHRTLSRRRTSAAASLSGSFVRSFGHRTSHPQHSRIPCVRRVRFEKFNRSTSTLCLPPSRQLPFACASVPVGVFSLVLLFL